jgi:hypothetical protein
MKKINIEKTLLHDAQKKRLLEAFPDGKIPVTEDGLRVVRNKGISVLTFAQVSLRPVQWQHYRTKLSPLVGDKAFSKAEIDCFIEAVEVK